MPTMRQIMETLNISDELLTESLTDSKIYNLIYQLDVAFEKINLNQIPEDQRQHWIQAKKHIGDIIESNSV